jgi:hypothetical protein
MILVLLLISTLVFFTFNCDCCLTSNFNIETPSTRSFKKLQDLASTFVGKLDMLNPYLKSSNFLNKCVHVIGIETMMLMFWKDIE